MEQARYRPGSAREALGHTAHDDNTEGTIPQEADQILKTGLEFRMVSYPQSEQKWLRGKRA